MPLHSEWPYPVKNSVTNQQAVATGESVNAKTGKGNRLPAVPALQMMEKTEKEKIIEPPPSFVQNVNEAPPPDKPFSSRAVTPKSTTVQARFAPIQKKQTASITSVQKGFAPVQRKENKTGIPDQLKSGVEQLSGMDISDIKVHYNSSKPAPLQAHAYAQGTDIHIASGQEKHLPHEAWHVVQQKQGRVQPTTEVNGSPVNDNVGLETEADTMGAQALQKAGEEKPADSFNDTGSEINTLQLHKELHDVAKQLGKTGTVQLAGKETTGFLKDNESTGDNEKMPASVFLANLKQATTLAAEKELKTIGQTTANCPFIDYWISFYQNMPAEKIEKGIHIYAPATIGINDPVSVIQLITEKVSTGLREQLAKSELKPVDPAEPAVLEDQQGEAKGLTPPAQLKETDVVQRGCNADVELKARPQRLPGESDDSLKLRRRLFAILPRNQVVAPNMPPRDGRAIDADLAPGNIRFATRDRNGFYGSIYFNAGRIRLEHAGGPEIDKTVGTQFTTTEIGANRFDALVAAKKNSQQIHDLMDEQGLLVRPVVVGAARLVEFFGPARGYTQHHLSRGGPVNIILSQDEINILLRGAETGNNAMLRHHMDADLVLRNFPTSAISF